MKFINSGILLLSTVFFLLTGCKKDNKADDAYKCTTCATSPEAKPANDGSSKGIYKGIVIGSTGSIKFDIQNAGTVIKASLTIDGTSVELTSAITWNGDRAYTAPFTGLLNGQSVTIQFSVGMDGSEPTITSATIPGHPNATFIIAKEASTALIECYEGTYHTTKPEDGTFNLILSRSLNLWGAIARQNGQSETNGVSGVIVNNKLIGDDGTTTMGTLSNDQISGSFKDDNNTTVTIQGKRTL